MITLEEAFANLSNVVKEFLPRKSLLLENPGRTLDMLNSLGVKLDNTLIGNSGYVSNTNEEPNIYLLEEGESTYVVPWAIFQNGDKYYINTSFIEKNSEKGGTCNTLVTRENGALVASIPFGSMKSVYEVNSFPVNYERIRL